MPSFGMAQAPPSTDLALLEHDDERLALIEPSEVLAHKRGSVPHVAVLCFFSEILEELEGRGAEEVGRLVAAHGTHPIRIVATEEARVAVVHPGVGAPLAAGFLEEMVAMGARTVVACGGAGAVVPGLPVGHVILPEAAVRDEGTSFHYLPPSREVEADPLGLRVTREVLDGIPLPYTVGKTWTTDAIYRETRSRIERRRNEGCLTVEMEAAALFAVARFRGIRFAQLLYAGDDVSGATWDGRHWSRSEARSRVFEAAVRVAVALDRHPR